MRREAGTIDIRAGDLGDDRVLRLIAVHLGRCRAESPPCSVHALDVSALQGPGIGFWAAWEAETLLGVGALAEVEPGHGELKSMHTAESARRRGVGSRMLDHLIGEARSRGYSRLSLETGSMDYFEPARAMYRRHGFAECGPFGKYAPDPNSVFMTMTIQADAHPHSIVRPE